MTNPTITHTHGCLTDCDSTTNWSEYKTVTMQAAGYVNCIAGDSNKTVTDDAAAIGTLWAYDNTLRIWTVKLTTFPTVIAAGSVMAITTGTGAGTSTGTSVATFTSDGDVFALTYSPTLPTNEYVYVEYTISPTVSSTLYKKCKVRWKTSAANDGCGIRVLLKFDTYDMTVSIAENVAAEKAVWIVGATVPEYSTTWVVTTTSILPTNRDIAKICIFADDYPDSKATWSFTVYADFVLIYADNFVFPNCETSKWEPNPKYTITSYPSRVGDDTQNVGSKNAQFHCICNLDLSNDTDDWKRPQGTLTPKDDYVAGQVFDEIAHRSYTEPWQWLDTGNRQIKVILENPSFDYQGEKHTINLLFTEKRTGTASTETYIERFGLNL